MAARINARTQTDAAATARPIGSIVDQMNTAFAGPTWTPRSEARRDGEPRERVMFNGLSNTLRDLGWSAGALAGRLPQARRKRG
ncbi:hypothetical protein SAMN05216241_10138 [Limimonas halophila]|uniref:Uncharacterized protein n=1 Tax=Limimonas halophila TaxID=1082479 RepID=A0A1G7KY27_9PROT|nr:hypothetical protein [Limimonas halophila]SDF42011.1 hypothetical protein SAMN05216241_10138 [Limimonas halophila]